jgi:phosphate transport system substrate-binding protein
MNNRVLRVAVALAAGAYLPTASAQVLNAAGGTFPAPIYDQWFEEFGKAHANIPVNYQAIGSGAGIIQLTAGAVDFGASDMPLTDQQIAAMKVKPLHFPTVLGAVVPIYNLPGVSQDVRLTPEVLAGIFLGRITKWNDPRITSLNPGLRLPSLDIVAVHRSDSSGTTLVFTDYLSKTEPDWKRLIGSGASVNWKGGVAEKGSDSVAARVKQTAGGLGYVELTYALHNRLAYGLVRNSGGTFVKADTFSVTASAAAAAANMPADFRVSITDAPGRNAYPISTFTWFIVPDHIADPVKRKAIADLLQWVLTTGQRGCEALGYAPLPKEVVSKELKQIARLKQ